MEDVLEPLSLVRLGRMCSAVRRVSQALEEAIDEASFRAAACRIVVEEGGFAAAWIASAGRPDPAAFYCRGDGSIPVPGGRGRFVSNDLQSEDGAGWREEAIGRGFRSCAVLPFNGKDNTGVLGLYAAEPGFFDEQALQLLGALTATLSCRLRNAPEARLRELLEAAPDAILECDAEGRILGANGAAERLFGYHRGELLAQRIENLVPERLRPAHAGHVAAYFTEPESRLIGNAREILAQRKDGTEVPVELSLSPIPTEQGGRVTCIIRDATAKHRAEDALRQSDLRVRNILERIADGFAAVDRQWRLTYLNRRAEQILGRKREELEGKYFWDEFPNLAGSAIQQGLQRAAEEERPIEFSAVYPPLSLWMEVHAYPSADGMSVFFQDITARKHAEQHSQQSQRLEALGRLAGEVAHDFNNLLTIIGGYSQIALEALDRSQGALRRDVEIVVEAAARASSLTRKLLAFSRRQVVQPRVLDLNRFVQKTAKMLDRMMREDIELQLVLRPGLWRIMADPGQIEQVLLNLAVNARDAMPVGGRISIQTENVEVGPDAPAEPQLAPGKYVLLGFSDTGTGLEQEARNHLFEPFFTTKARGTGLGLATVYGIVKQSGGEISVDSETGKGTRFAVYFPRTERTAQRKKARGGLKTCGGKETVLLVEDDGEVRRLTRTMLTQLGYRVLDAAAPSEALGIWDNERRPIDLLLTDVIMPQMSGRELADRLLGLRPDLKVLYMSGYTEDVILLRGVEVGKAALLQKPFTREALALKVRTVLDVR